MRRIPTPIEAVTTALHTVLHKVPDGHPDDVLDAIYSMVGQQTFDAVGSDKVTDLIYRFT